MPTCIALHWLFVGCSFGHQLKPSELDSGAFLPDSQVKDHGISEDVLRECYHRGRGFRQQLFEVSHNAHRPSVRPSVRHPLTEPRAMAACVCVRVCVYPFALFGWYFVQSKSHAFNLYTSLVALVVAGRPNQSCKSWAPKPC